MWRSGVMACDVGHAWLGTSKGSTHQVEPPCSIQSPPVAAQTRTDDSR